MDTENRDAQNILQLVIDADQLEKYYHADVLPQRVPLRLLRNDHVPEELQLTKFDRPVVLTDAEEPDGPYFEVTDFQQNDDEARVAFRYPPEGIVGTATLAKQNDRWSLQDVEIRER